MQNNLIHRVMASANKGTAQRLLGHTNNAIKFLGHTNNFLNKIGHSNKHLMHTQRLAEKYVSPVLKEVGDVVA